jgi:hypothetical protein
MFLLDLLLGAYNAEKNVMWNGRMVAFYSEDTQ